MNDLAGAIRASLARPVDATVRLAAGQLAELRGGVAVLFYGSVLRTGELGDVLDFYVLTDASAGHRGRLWPDVSYHELAVEGRTVRAKVAAMPLAAFRKAARGEGRDTTIWTRFAQPSALVHATDDETAAAVHDAIADAAITAAQFAALHGPPSGDAGAYWRALFRATYATELRVEAPGREAQIVEQHRGYFTGLLPLAWAAGNVAFSGAPDRLTPTLQPAERRRLARRWARARRTGKALNAARLVKGAFTFEGAAAYGLYKVARHTGIEVPLTPWRARHPILAAPAVLWRVWRLRTSS